MRSLPLPKIEGYDFFADTGADETDTAPSTRKPTKKVKKNSSSVTIPSGSLAQAKAETDSATAEVMIAGMPNNGEGDPDEHSYIEITHADGEKSLQDVQCLFCGTKID